MAPQSRSHDRERRQATNTITTTNTIMTTTTIMTIPMTTIMTTPTTMGGG